MCIKYLCQLSFVRIANLQHYCTIYTVRRMDVLRRIYRSYWKFRKIMLITILIVSSYIAYTNIIAIKPKVPSNPMTKTGFIPATNNNINIRDRNLVANRSEEISHSTTHNGERDINVLITFTNANHNGKLQENFKTTVTSLLRFSTVPVKFYILADKESGRIAENILSRNERQWMYKVIHINIDQLYAQFNRTISDLRTNLKVKHGTQYSDAFYFISIVIHKALHNLDRIIMLDCDLKINDNIKELYKYFDRFSASTVIGMAYETQPTYRHYYSVYRAAHKGTRIGDPPPDGLPGFNSGVVLADLEKMRTSDLYNSLFHNDVLTHLAEKYSFQLILGDQDIFTLLSLEYSELFYVLPCTWNRQLCVYFRDNGYNTVFDEYYRCEGRISIYHGNGGTKLPTLEWEK